MKFKLDKELFLILFGDSILFVGIIIAITVLWQLLELAAYGEIRPSEVDTVIAMLFGISVYINLKTVFKLWQTT